MPSKRCVMRGQNKIERAELIAELRQRDGTGGADIFIGGVPMASSTSSTSSVALLTLGGGVVRSWRARFIFFQRLPCRYPARDRVRHHADHDRPPCFLDRPPRSRALRGADRDHHDLVHHPPDHALSRALHHGPPTITWNWCTRRCAQSSRLVHGLDHGRVRLAVDDIVPVIEFGASSASSSPSSSPTASRDPRDDSLEGRSRIVRRRSRWLELSNPVTPLAAPCCSRSSAASVSSSASVSASRLLPGIERIHQGLEFIDRELAEPF